MPPGPHAVSPRQGEFETVKAVLSAAPILIAYLGGGSGLPVAEQCAWALGELSEGPAGRGGLAAVRGEAPPRSLAPRCLPGIVLPGPTAVAHSSACTRRRWRSP